MAALSLRLLTLLGVALSATSCDVPWMEQKVRLQDGTVITLQHRGTGTFRTIVANKHGDVTVDYDGAADSRHVSLYTSPSRRIIIADYDVLPMIVEVGDGQRPVEVSPQKREAEYGLSPKWQYFGSVRRTDDSRLRYFPDDPECQSFGRFGAGVPRKVTRCRDSNYVGVNDQHRWLEGSPPAFIRSVLEGQMTANHQRGHPGVLPSK